MSTIEKIFELGEMAGLTSQETKEKFPEIFSESLIVAVEKSNKDYIEIKLRELCSSLGLPSDLIQLAENTTEPSLEDRALWLSDEVTWIFAKTYTGNMIYPVVKSEQDVVIKDTM
jgi:hypothetical protein